MVSNLLDRIKNGGLVSKIAIALVITLIISVVSGMAGVWRLGGGDIIDLYGEEITNGSADVTKLTASDFANLPHNTTAGGSNVTHHMEDTSNPHSVTPGQIGAIENNTDEYYFNDQNITELALNALLDETGSVGSDNILDNSLGNQDFTYAKINKSDESSLDVNSSNTTDYWDNLDTESDLTPSNFLTAGSFLKYSGDSLYVDMAFSGLNNTQGSPSDGQGWCWNATSGNFEPCSVGGDGYLPDDPPTSDTNFNDTNVTGVKRFESIESVSSQGQFNESAEYGNCSTGQTYYTKNNDTGWFKLYCANDTVYCYDYGDDRGCY